MALFNPTSFLGQKINKLLYGSQANNIIFNSVQPTIFGGLAIYPDPNTMNFVKLGYCGNASVYTIVTKAARKFGYLPRYVYKIEDQTAANRYKAMLRSKGFNLKEIKALQQKAYNEQIVDNAFSELMARPNDYEGQDSFYEKIFIYYAVTGEAFIRLNRGYQTLQSGRIIYNDEEIDNDTADKMPVLEMDVLPSQDVLLIPDPENVFGVLGYYFVISGVREFVRKEDMIHWKQPNPIFDAHLRTHQRGLSPLLAGNKLVTQDDSATNAAVSMQQNQGAKSVLYNKNLNNLDPVQKSQLQDVIDTKINNTSKKGSVAVVQGDWGALDLGQTAVDMQLMESIKEIFIRLCNLFDVPSEVFINGSTYNNTEQAVKALITGLLLPMSCSLRDEMNRVLLPAFGLDKTFTSDVDISGVTELQDDQLKLVQAAAAAYWKTQNEKREMTNDEKSTDPNMDKYFIPNNLITLEDAVAEEPLNSYSGAKPKNNTDSPGAIPDNLPGEGS